MEIFGKQIRIRDYVCSPTGGFHCHNTKVNLYVCANSFCPASCCFCPGFKSRNKFDLSKFKKALTELHNKDVINRIGITGGEPLANLGRLNDILMTINDVCGSDTYHISINTNGTNLSFLRDIESFSFVNDIHISRHAIRDAENDKIFGIRTPTVSQIKRECELTKDVFSLSCNLMRGYIDSPKRLREYLDMAIHVGAYQVGFVSLMEKTKACKDLFIDYEDITFELYVKDGFLFENMSKDKKSCKCENFLYMNEDGEIHFYLRRIFGGKQNCVKAFIYNQDNNLVANFGKDIVLL